MSAYRNVAPFILGTLILGCGGRFQQTPSVAADYYQEAQKALERGDCLKATDNFQRVVTSFPGADLADDAQFGLAESYFCAKDYVTAIFEYEKLREYRSGWSDDAQYKIALCYYHLSLPAPLDQSDTHRAILTFRRFLEDYPDSPMVPDANARIRELQDRLGEKIYRTARNYAKWGHPDAARVYYEKVLTEYRDTKWVPSAHFGIGEVLQEQNRPEQALDHLQETLRISTDAELTRKAQEKVKDIERHLATGVEGSDRE